MYAEKLTEYQDNNTQGSYDHGFFLWTGNIDLDWIIKFYNNGNHIHTSPVKLVWADQARRVIRAQYAVPIPGHFDPAHLTKHLVLKGTDA
jgi:hypothetical protein